MQPVEVVSVAYRTRQLAIVARARAAARTLWAGVDPGDIGGSWSPQIARMVGVTMLSQKASATGSTLFVGAMLTAQGTKSAPEAQTFAAAFADSAADGRPLGSLLYQPVMRARALAGEGTPTDLAYRMAGQQLEMLVASEVADAGRDAMSTAMLADQTVTGYYRQGGSCARCAILAGKWSRTFQGAAFLRHPGCRCTAVPGTDRSTSFAASPTDYFHGLSRQQQDHVFGAGNSEMIRAGADPAAVINARRGMSGPGAWTTTEGGTKGSLYGGYIHNPDGSLTARTRGEKAPPRLTPSAINRLSATREEAVTFLRQYGYLF